jgi:hypothetical protein
MVGTLATCCAFAMNGKMAAVQPIAATNSRRRIGSPVGTPHRRPERSTLQRCDGKKAQSIIPNAATQCPRTAAQ